ncbi:MAG TPA: hydroxyacid dehydrogenase [Abditibacteriaceae bacterium]|nr:hydroxyacid dehydrogenase [Abditibacteriaceae bacterium]
MKVLCLPTTPELLGRVFTPATWDALRAEFDVTQNDGQNHLQRAELLARIAGYDAAVTTWGSPRFGREVLDMAPQLKLIAHAAGSVKFLFAPDEIPHLQARGLAIYSGNDAIALNVAESTIGLMIAVSRRWPEHAATFKTRHRRDYAQPPLDGQYLSGATVGLISASKVARHVVRLLQPFGCRILLYDPFLSEDAARALGVARATLNEVFEQGDIVSVHAPALPATAKMIGATQLKKLRDGATFINTSRGAVVDEAALTEECRNGRILAALDVTDPEPAAPDSPLWELPNVILLPHISGAGCAGYHAIGAGVLQSLRDLKAGRPIVGSVPLERWDTLA